MCRLWINRIVELEFVVEVELTGSQALGGEFLIGGSLRVHRLGYGAMQITGPGVWGEPKDRSGALAVLRRAVELGVDFIDTADSYGPSVSEELIGEVLSSRSHSVKIATKAGLVRTGPGVWLPVSSTSTTNSNSTIRFIQRRHNAKTKKGTEGSPVALRPNGQRLPCSRTPPMRLLIRRIAFAQGDKQFALMG